MKAVVIWLSARHQPNLQDNRLTGLVSCMVCLSTSQLTPVPNYTAWSKRQYMNNVPRLHYTEQQLGLNRILLDL